MKCIYGLLTLAVVLLSFSCQNTNSSTSILFFGNETLPDAITLYDQVSSANSAKALQEENLQQYSTIVISNTEIESLPLSKIIALERYLEAGGGIVLLKDVNATNIDYQAYQDRVRGVLKSDYQGQNPSDLGINFSLTHLDFITSLYLKENKKDSWRGEYAAGKIVCATQLDAELLSYTIGTNSRDYSKVKAQFVPDESRFVKEELVNNLNEPMKMDVLPDGRIIFIERKGEATFFNPETGLLQPAGQFDVYTGFEDGLLGVAVDPKFVINNWLYFDYSPPEKSVNRISRFTLKDDLIDFSSEKILIEIPTDRGTCCHSAGAMAFDADGNLYITMGDDTNPWISEGMAPIDNRVGDGYGDARRSAGNTNDLRGKILRIKPLDDGTYSIPEGNLFPKGNPKARPEIYVMGVRNPFTISLNPKNGHLYWGDVGPDAGEADSLRGPRAYDEINLATQAGNFGWPFTRGNRQVYRDYDLETNTAGNWFDPDNLVNNSINNTGLVNLPAAENSLIWYPYASSEEFPWTASGGKNPMVGPVYQSEKYTSADRFPEYFDDKLFVFEWMRHWIYTLELDEAGNYKRSVPFMSNTEFSRPMDMVFGKDGALYVLEYGNLWFARNMDARLSRIKYVRGNREPVARIKADKTSGAAPLTVNFSGEDSTDPDQQALTYEWNFAGYPSQSGSSTSFTYKYPGIYEVELVVRDESGLKSRQKISVQVGNEAPEVDLIVEGNQMFYWEENPIKYSVAVNDKEDGNLQNGITEDRVSFILDLLPNGQDLALTEVGHQAADALSGLSRGELLIEKSDCKSCHAIDKKVNGPSYTQIAKKYDNTATLVTQLSRKIITGGNGVWGETNMSAHPQLTDNQTKTMVRWILSLDEKSDKKKSLPLAGRFNPEIQPKNDEGVKQHGIYVLSASYTDNGAGKVEPLTGRDMLRLRAPVLQATQADRVSLKTPDRLNNWLNNIPVGEEFSFKNIDLTDVGGVHFRVRGQTGKSHKVGVEIGAKGVVEPLGQIEFMTKNKEAKDLFVPLREIEGKQDLYVKVMDAGQEYTLDFNYLYLSKRESASPKKLISSLK